MTLFMSHFVHKEKQEEGEKVNRSSVDCRDFSYAHFHVPRTLYFHHCRYQT